MNSLSLVKGLMIFGAGVTAGAFGMYLATKDFFDKFVQRELEARDEYYQRKYGTVEKAKEEEKKEPEKKPDDISSLMKKKETMEKVNYQKEAARYGGYPMSDDPSEEEYPSDDRTGVEIITEFQYYHTEPHYETQELLWYEGNNIFTTDEGLESEEMPEVYDWFPSEAFDRFGEETEEKVYICNHNVNTKYVVQRIHRSWIPNDFVD